MVLLICRRHPLGNREPSHGLYGTNNDFLLFFFIYKQWFIGSDKNSSYQKWKKYTRRFSRRLTHKSIGNWNRIQWWS